MKSLRARSTGLLVALVMGALAILPSTPKDVGAATCGPYRRVTYYAEPAKVNVVGVCTTYCNNSIPTSCTGTTSPYYTTVSAECFACAG
jgi:hypothetical protein